MISGGEEWRGCVCCKNGRLNGWERKFFYGEVVTLLFRGTEKVINPFGDSVEAQHPNLSIPPSPIFMILNTLSLGMPSKVQPLQPCLLHQMLNVGVHSTSTCLVPSDGAYVQKRSSAFVARNISVIPALFFVFCRICQVMIPLVQIDRKGCEGMTKRCKKKVRFVNKHKQQ